MTLTVHSVPITRPHSQSVILERQASNIVFSGMYVFYISKNCCRLRKPVTILGFKISCLNKAWQYGVKSSREN